MSNYSRGADVQIYVTTIQDDGSSILLPLGSPTAATFNLDSAEERDDRLGKPESDTTQVVMGASGSITLRRDSHLIDQIMMRSVESQRNRTKTPKYAIDRAIYSVETGLTKIIRYPNCTFKVNTSSSGKDDAVEDTIEWLGGLPLEIGA